jgi:hypothetical protein
VPLLFAVTLFVSASLLFMVQPMVGRMILPLLGGSPAAWNTCMVFFQAMLLLGYLYAHKLTNRFAPRSQVGMHMAVLGVTILIFVLAVTFSPNHSPIAVVRGLAPQNTPYPMFGVLTLLFVAIGVPFFAVSTSAPLLQRWFAYTGHSAARDPYFLYAASNAGSLLALLGYPLVLEPSLRLIEQAWMWAGGFILLTGLITLCGRQLVGASIQSAKSPGRVQPAMPAPSDPGPAPSWGQRLRWIGLAFVPSSLMLGVTTYMTTDIASVPLLWVIPLALYLLTFIIAFARMPNWFRPLIGNVAPVVVLLLVFVLTSQQTLTTFWMLGLHLLTYFLLALLLHTELAHERPPPAHLTNYFLWISVGGVLGGVFNALVAPIAFPLPYEYPIALAVGCMLIPKLDEFTAVVPSKSAGQTSPNQGRDALVRLLDLFIPLTMLAAVAALTLLPNWQVFVRASAWLAEHLTAALQYVGLQAGLEAYNVMVLIMYAVPAMICFLFIDRPLRFGLCVAAILIVGYYRQIDKRVIRTDRSFFGILKVEEYAYTRRLVHGTTLHGTQFTDPWPFIDELKEPLSVLIGAPPVYGLDYRQEPLTYYHRTGPVGHMFEVMRAKDPMAPVAMVGLGTGSVSCYALPGQKLTYYEIDPSVKELVADTDEYFTYVKDAERRGADIEIVMGDARLKLEEHVDRRYQLLFIDAFSSDSIPVHLLTKEAVALYMDRVTEDGLVGIHISNKYVKLEPVVARIAEDLGLAALVFSDGWVDSSQRNDSQLAPIGKTQSSWVVLARRAEQLKVFDQPQFTTSYEYRYLDAVPPTNRWSELHTDPAVRTWTDDYSDVLSVMMIKEIQRARRFFGLPVMEELLE